MHVLIKSKWINEVKVVTFLSFINSFDKSLSSTDYVPAVFCLQGCRELSKNREQRSYNPHPWPVLTIVTY